MYKHSAFYINLVSMNKIAIIAVVLTCVAVGSASGLIIYYPVQQQAATPSTTLPTPWHSNPPLQPWSTPKIPSYGGTIALSNLYDAKLTYVYIGPTNSKNTYPNNYYPEFAALSLTYLGNPQNEPWDEKFEGYFINYTSDTGIKRVYLGWFGTNYNLSSSYLPAPFPGSPRGPTQSVSAKFNLVVGQTIYGQVPNSVGYGSSNGTLGLWQNGTPNAITVTIQRAGWVTVNGKVTTTITNPSALNVIQRVELNKDGAGFIYGSKPTS
jgi:hypothetical protein